MILDNKIIKAVFPFIGTLLLLLGFLKLSFFYSFFNIQIYDYLELSEVLTLYLSDIIHFGLMIGLILLVHFIFVSKEKTEKIKRDRRKLTDVTNGFDRLKCHYNINKKLIWLSLFLIILYFIQFIRSSEQLWGTIEFTIVMPLFLLFDVILLEFKYKYKESYDKYFNTTSEFLILIFFVFSFCSFTSVYKDLRDLEDDRRLVSFVYENDIVKTNDKLIYVGQTKNYLFLSNKQKKEFQVFERSRLSKMKITSGN